MPTREGRILFIERDTDNRELASFIRAGAGFEAICTDSANRLLDLARMEKFGLYLLDDWRLKVSGEELCKRIRKFDLKTPILFYSGAAFETEKAPGLRSWRTGLLGKASPWRWFGEGSYAPNCWS